MGDLEITVCPLEFTNAVAICDRIKTKCSSKGSPVADSENSANRSQIATGSQRHRDPRFMPYVFTEHGAVMAANILKSERAIQMSICVVRAFVRLRDILGASRELAKKLQELETRIAGHDESIGVLFDAIRALVQEPEKPKRTIGFTAKEKRAAYRT